MAKIVIPFTIDEDDVNTLDTVPYTLFSTSSRPTICVVPVRLELTRLAGTAYSLVSPYHASSAGAVTNALYPFPDTGQFDPHVNQVEPLWMSEDLIVYNTNVVTYSGRSDRETIFFRIPADTLLNTTAETKVVAFPVSGVVLQPGSFDLKMECLTGISGGTGDLYGRLFLDEIEF